MVGCEVEDVIGAPDLGEGRDLITLAAQDVALVHLVERHAKGLRSRSELGTVLLQRLKQTDVDPFVFEGQHLAVCGEAGQGVGVAEHRTRCRLGRRIVVVLGEQAGRDSQFDR